MSVKTPPSWARAAALESSEFTRLAGDQPRIAIENQPPICGHGKTMSDGLSQTAATAPRPGGQFPGAPALAWTFVFVGVGYAFPILLFPEEYPLNGPVSSEILNLNFLVAWMGLAHFIFAYAGQAKSLRRATSRASAWYCASLVVAGLGLAILRGQVISRIFDSIIWVYFIPHFIKAELHFIRNTQQNLVPSAKALYWFPALGFGYLTFALFGPLTLSFHTAALIGVALLCVAAGLAGGILQQLYQPDYAPFALLGFFFLGEGLVWGTYLKYMTPQFRQGVYVFHIAVASFYHYFQSYAFAWRKLPADGALLNKQIVVLANLLLVGLGVAVVFHPQARAAQWVFGLPFFTFWVGLHLLSSDIFGALRRIPWQRS
jgi:hypothetical protein